MKSEIIMLPSDIGDCPLFTENNEIGFFPTSKQHENNNIVYQNLYLLMPELAIYTGDYVYDGQEIGEVVKIDEIGEKKRAIVRFISGRPETLARRLSDCIKVAYSTKLLDGVGKLPYSFIEYYSKNPIKNLTELENKEFQYNNPVTGKSTWTDHIKSVWAVHNMKLSRYYNHPKLIATEKSMAPVELMISAKKLNGYHNYKFEDIIIL
jgi:hypothetical protein